MQDMTRYMTDADSKGQCQLTAICTGPAPAKVFWPYQIRAAHDGLIMPAH